MVVMLDKDTILKKKDDPGTESEDGFKTCLKRAREVAGSRDKLCESIERFLDNISEDE